MAVVIAGEGGPLVLARETRPAEGDGADTNPSIGPTPGRGLLRPWMRLPEEDRRPHPRRAD